MRLDNYTQTLQDQIGQLGKLLGVQNSSPMPQPQPIVPGTNQFDLVTGLDGARSFMTKMLSNTKHIVWDNEQPIFYVLQKDANGNPQRIQICKFEMTLEPTMEEKYVSREDFNALVSKLDQLLNEKQKPTKEVKTNG